jgi:hypothetical protein
MILCLNIIKLLSHLAHSLQKTIGLQTYDPFEPSLFITNRVARGGLVVWLFGWPDKTRCSKIVKKKDVP